VAEFRARADRYRTEPRYTFRPGDATGIRGPYLGETPPGTTPRLFAPGFVSRALANEGTPTMSPDGTEIYFTRNTQMLVTRLGRDGWTFPEPVGFSAGFPAGEEHLTRDNSRMYFLWARPIPPGEPNPKKMNTGVWASDRLAGGWSPPKYVGLGMFVSSTNDGEIYVTDETDAPHGYLAKARVVDGKFAGFERLKGGMEQLRSATVTNIAHPAVAPDGSYIVFDLGNPPLFVCFRQSDGTWGDAIDLSRHGVGSDAFMAYVSPDGKYLFYSTVSHDVYWVSARIVEDLQPLTRR
jgi:hypothetical protein